MMKPNSSQVPTIAHPFCEPPRQGPAGVIGRTLEAAFSRIELVAILAALVLLAAVVLPAFAGSKAHSDRVACLNNLRQLGMAIQRWAGDHGDRPPWWTPWCEGGSRTYSSVCNGTLPPWNGLHNNLWFQLAYLTNDLPSPQLLVCPADNLRAASDWSSDPAGGFLNPVFKNNAIGYFIGLDANGPLDRPDFFSNPMVLAGDRNLSTNGIGACSTGVQNAAVITARNPPTTVWIQALHGLNGNLLHTDGQALSANTTRLRQALTSPYDSSSVHLLFAR